jgi:hypothetical protein
VPFTPDQLARLQAHVGKNWKSGGCPMCRSHTLSVQGRVDLVLRDIVSHRGEAVPQQAALPTGAVTCATCGYTMLINLVFAGILNEDGSNV